MYINANKLCPVGSQPPAIPTRGKARVIWRDALAPEDFPNHSSNDGAALVRFLRDERTDQLITLGFVNREKVPNVLFPNGYKDLERFEQNHEMVLKECMESDHVRGTDKRWVAERVCEFITPSSGERSLMALRLLANPDTRLDEEERFHLYNYVAGGNGSELKMKLAICSMATSHIRVAYRKQTTRKSSPEAVEAEALLDRLASALNDAGTNSLSLRSSRLVEIAGLEHAYSGGKRTAKESACCSIHRTRRSDPVRTFARTEVQSVRTFAAGRPMSMSIGTSLVELHEDTLHSVLPENNRLLNLIRTTLIDKAAGNLLIPNIAKNGCVYLGTAKVNVRDNESAGRAPNVGTGLMFFAVRDKCRLATAVVPFAVRTGTPDNPQGPGLRVLAYPGELLGDEQSTIPTTVLRNAWYLSRNLSA